MKPNRMYVLEYTCDVCGMKLCQEGKGLDSFFCSDEHYKHFCKEHTKLMNDYITTLIQNFSLVPLNNLNTT